MSEKRHKNLELLIRGNYMGQKIVPINNISEKAKMLGYGNITDEDLLKFKNCKI